MNNNRTNYLPLVQAMAQIKFNQRETKKYENIINLIQYPTLPGTAKNTNINPKPLTNMRSDERTHPHAANQHQHIKTQSNKSNQNNTQIQHKNNEFQRPAHR